MADETKYRSLYLALEGFLHDSREPRSRINAQAGLLTCSPVGINHAFPSMSESGEVTG
jgi:hypothetical protein